jgi:hypothetical protein
MIRKGAKIFGDLHVGAIGASESAMNRQQVAYDGERSSTFTPKLGRALAKSGLLNEVAIAGIDYLELSMLGPTKEQAPVPNLLDLVAILKASATSVHKELEWVGGRRCYAVDSINGPPGEAATTV